MGVIIRNVLYESWVPLWRILAGLTLGLLLAVLGGWAGLFLNLLLGYHWPLAIHQSIQMVTIGAGAGLGAYLAWLNSNLRWYWILGTLALVVAASTLGAYAGRAYGPGIDPTYVWSRSAVDNAIHVGAAIAGVLISTTIGLAGQIYIANFRSAEGVGRRWF